MRRGPQCRPRELSYARCGRHRSSGRLIMAPTFRKLHPHFVAIRSPIRDRYSGSNSRGRSRLEGAAHPLLHTNPRTQRRSLYLASHAWRIIDWPLPEGRLLLRDLIEHATQARFVYRHIRRPGDLLIWDNPPPCTAAPLRRRKVSPGTASRDDAGHRVAPRHLTGSPAGRGDALPGSMCKLNCYLFASRKNEAPRPLSRSGRLCCLGNPA